MGDLAHKRVKGQDDSSLRGSSTILPPPEASDSRYERSDSMDTDDDPSQSLELWCLRELDWADIGRLELRSQLSSPTVIISAHLAHADNVIGTLDLSEWEWSGRCFHQTFPKRAGAFKAAFSSPWRYILSLQQ